MLAKKDDWYQQVRFVSLLGASTLQNVVRIQGHSPSPRVESRLGLLRHRCKKVDPCPRHGPQRVTLDTKARNLEREKKGGSQDA